MGQLAPMALEAQEASIQPQEGASVRAEVEATVAEPMEGMVPPEPEAREEITLEPRAGEREA